MTRPVRIAAGVVAGAALLGAGALAGDLLTDDDTDSPVALRAPLEVAAADTTDAAQAGLTIVSVGAPSSGAPDDTAPTTSEPFDAVPGAAPIDVDAFDRFDAAVEDDGADPSDIDTGETGPLVDDVLVDEVYAPAVGDEDPPIDDTADPDGDGSTTSDEPGATVPRPDGVPRLDPGIYDLELPTIVGFDDPCARGPLPGCPAGVPATVLGDDPIVPLRLGSVGVLGTAPFHRDVCASAWDDVDDATTALAITTNQAVEIRVTLDATDTDVVAETAPLDASTATFAAARRGDERVPSDGAGSVVTCVTVPTKVADDGLLTGRATATSADGDQTDDLDFELRLAGTSRRRPISFSPADRFPVPRGSSGFELTVPQGAPTTELAVVGILPLERGRFEAPTECSFFEPQLAEVRSRTLGGREKDDGEPALPVGLSGALDETGRLSPRGTYALRPRLIGDAPDDGYNATFRGYLAAGEQARVCVWWFDLVAADGGHRVAGAAADTVTMIVRAGIELRPGVFVTGITTLEDRPPGFYNLYLVKPGIAAICLPRKRPADFPVGPVGGDDEPRAVVVEEIRPVDSETESTEDEAAADATVSETDTASPGAAVGGTIERTDAEKAADTDDGLIPAGHHRFGPRQAQELVEICVPRARSPFAIPMVKAGRRPYIPSSPPIPLDRGRGVLPDGLAPPPLGIMYPIVAPDGAILELSVIHPAAAVAAQQWTTGGVEPIPPATVRSTVELDGDPDIERGPDPRSVAVIVRFTENVTVVGQLTDSGGAAPCTVGGVAMSAASATPGSVHELRFDGLCAGRSYGFRIEATDADGAVHAFDGGRYVAPVNAGLFDVTVEVTGAPASGAVLSVADVQFVRQPGIVSLSSRSRARDLLGECLSAGDVDADRTVLTSFGESAEIRVRVEGRSGCDDDGTTIRLDSALEVAAADLAAGAAVFDVSHPSGLVLRVSVTPRTP